MNYLMNTLNDREEALTKVNEQLGAADDFLVVSSEWIPERNGSQLQVTCFGYNPALRRALAHFLADLGIEGIAALLDDLIKITKGDIKGEKKTIIHPFKKTNNDYEN